MTMIKNIGTKKGNGHDQDGEGDDHNQEHNRGQ
jgi:hypothetical protein